MLLHDLFTENILQKIKLASKENILLPFLCSKNIVRMFAIVN